MRVDDAKCRDADDEALVIFQEVENAGHLVIFNIERLYKIEASIIDHVRDHHDEVNAGRPEAGEVLEGKVGENVEKHILRKGVEDSGH